MDSNKRKNIDVVTDQNDVKRMKKECSYGEKCYRKNPVHFREFSHAHLELILDNYSGDGDFPIPDKFRLERSTIEDQLKVILEKKFYAPGRALSNGKETEVTVEECSEVKNIQNDTKKATDNVKESSNGARESKNEEAGGSKLKHKIPLKVDSGSSEFEKTRSNDNDIKKNNVAVSEQSNVASSSQGKDPDYRAIVPPTRRIQDYMNVVAPKGKMLEKHNRNAPYYLFYTTITAAAETHRQDNSITFQEILDSSLGELKCSLQINFMVEIGWLLGHYYFAGYANKKLTILYGEECSDMKTVTQKRPNVDAHYVDMSTPFGKHHTKMMILCYEDGSLRVVISTANLYMDDWENRTQGLWFSPKCEELPETAMPFDGESATGFKRSLLNYLNQYQKPQIAYYVERVKRCDFSKINVFLVASAPGGHFDHNFGLSRVGSLLKQHCKIPPAENHQWDLIAQASSIGSYGKQPELWLTGDFLHNFTKVQNQSQLLAKSLPKLKLVYPSLENVRQSHDGLLGGGCLPYAAEAHTKQLWLNKFLYQWKAKTSGRDRAMPHIKSYIRISPDSKRAAYYILTSGNVSKAAWGTFNKGNGALRIMSYEAGVMFLPQFVINKDFFSLDKSVSDHLSVPYDLPPVPYEGDMSPWVMDYLR